MIRSKIPTDEYKEGWERLFGAMRRKSGLPEQSEPVKPYTQEYLREQEHGDKS